MILELLRAILGFDPFALAGVPSGFVQIYLTVAAITLPLFISVGYLMSSKPRMRRWRLAVIPALVAMLLATQYYHDVNFITVADYPITLRDEPASKNFIVALPMRFVADETDKLFMPGGKYFDLTSPLDVHARFFGPGAGMTAYLTVLVHLTMFIVTFGACIALLTMAVVDGFRKLRSLRKTI